MRLLKDIFENNKKWAAQMQREDPDFFKRLATQQSPQILWIGCSDSRVPANEITGLMPGEVFVHRNISNVVNFSDINCLSVIQYAVDVLKVMHIVVAGHYGCGGVKRALEPSRTELIDQWLFPIREIRQRHDEFLRALPDEQTKWDKLCELNVIEQTNEVCRTSFVRNAWAKGHNIGIHGWIYSIHDGRLRDMNTTVERPEEIDGNHDRALHAVLTSRDSFRSS